MKEYPFIIIGSGLSGKMAAIQLMEKGHKVCLISQDHPLQSDSLNLKNGFLSTHTLNADQKKQYIEDSLRAGDGLSHRHWLEKSLETSAQLFDYFSELGVNWIRDHRNKLLFRKSLGSKYAHEVHTGINTSFMISKVLSDQLKRYENEKRIESFYHWKVLSLIKDDHGKTRGVIAQHTQTMEIRPFISEVIIVASGGMGQLFKPNIQSQRSYGSFLSHLYEEGNPLANLEFIQFSPAVYHGINFTIDLAPLALTTGARFWTYRDGKPWYFLEDLSHHHADLPTIVMSRFIHKVIYDLGLGIRGHNYIFADFTEISENNYQLDDFKNWCLKNLNIDPSQNPLPVSPGPIHFLGGLKIQNNYQGTIPGVFSCGEAACSHHGASAVESNLLVGSLMTGLEAAKAAHRYFEGKTKLKTISSSLIESTMYKEHQMNNQILEKEGDENPYLLFDELQSWMSQHLGIVRDNDGLQALDQKIEEIENKAHKMMIFDRGKWVNQNLFFIRDFLSSLELAKAMTRSALSRNESRGSHYKPEFNMKDDERYLKNTLASYTGIGPKIEYEDMDS